MRLQSPRQRAIHQPLRSGARSLRHRVGPYDGADAKDLFIKIGVQRNRFFLLLQAAMAQRPSDPGRLRILKTTPCNDLFRAWQQSPTQGAVASHALYFTAPSAVFFFICCSGCSGAADTHSKVVDNRPIERTSTPSRC